MAPLLDDDEESKDTRDREDTPAATPRTGDALFDDAATAAETDDDES